MKTMNTRFLIPSLFSIALLASCGGEQKPAEEAAPAPETQEPVAACTYSYSDAPVTVEWVAYKYTEKTAVSGKFKQVTVNGGGEGSVADALMGANISIETASSNSGDPTRDPKIKETFFGSLMEGETLSGVISHAMGDETAGQVTADINMNGMTHPIDGRYEVKDGQIEMKFEFTVDLFGANEALNALNKVCEDLHKGSDGNSVLWPDVTVFVTTELDKSCE